MAFTPTRMLNKQSPLSAMTLDQMLLIHGEMPTIKSPLPPRQQGRAYTNEERRNLLRTRTAAPNPNNAPRIPTKAPRSLTPIIEQHAQAVVDEARQAATLEAKSRGKHRPQPKANTRRSPGSTTPSSTPQRPVAPGGATQSSDRPGFPATPQTQRPAPPSSPPVSTPARPAPGKAHVLVSPTLDPDPEYADDISMSQPCDHVVELVFEVETESGTMTVAYPMYCEVLGRHPNQPHMMKVYGRSQDPADPDQDVFVGWGDVLA